jgi:hypothetical protein
MECADEDHEGELSSSSSHSLVLTNEPGRRRLVTTKPKRRSATRRPSEAPPRAGWEEPKQRGVEPCTTVAALELH